MKKIAVLFMVLILTGLMVLGMSAGYSTCTVYKTDTPPTLDGAITPDDNWGEPIKSLKSFEEVREYAASQIPSVWPEYAVMYGNVLYDTQLMPSAIDLYMRWDDLYFYLGVQIKVATRCAPQYKDIWNYDCVYINFMDDPYVWDQTSQLSIQFTVHDDGDFIYEWWEKAWIANPITTDSDWCGVRDEVNKTTTYELRFFWDESLNMAVGHQMQAGDMFGMNIDISPQNFDGEPYNIIDIVPAGIDPNNWQDQYNWAITLADEPADGADSAETAAPVETEAPAEEPVSAPSDWAAEEVSAAIGVGLVPKELQKNYTDGITRADLSKMLGILIDNVYGKNPAKNDAAFTDTTDAAVLKAANLGIINGYAQDDGTFMFKPDNTLKRSEMSAIINRVAKLCGEKTTGYDDEVKFADTADHWCNAELGYPVHMGIVKGTSETTFSPENTLTVEQTIMMIYRTFTKLAADGWQSNIPGVYKSDVKGIDFFLNVAPGKDIEIVQFNDPQIISLEGARNDIRRSDLKDKALGDGTLEENLGIYLTTVLENSDPDLIVLDGDLVYGETDDSGESFLALIELMDSFRIPWACCFGNHDNESNKGVLWQCEQLENSEYCVFARGSVTGNSNYNIVIRQDGEIKYTVFLLDTNGCRVLPREGSGIQAENPDYGCITQTEGIYEDQIQWFVNSNKAIHTLTGKKTVPNVVFMHIPMNGIYVAANEKYQPKDLTRSLRCNMEGDFGFIREGVHVGCLVDNSGDFLEACKDNGTLGFFYGHNHNDDASIEWEGIRYTFGSKCSTYDYNMFGVLGGTQILLDDETAALSVAHLKYSVLAKK